MSKLLCPKCGSSEFEDLPREKGSQKKCRKCGFEGNQLMDLG